MADQCFEVGLVVVACLLVVVPPQKEELESTKVKRLACRHTANPDSELLNREAGDPHLPLYQQRDLEAECPDGVQNF